MIHERNPVASVIGPNGDVLTEADLPPRNAARWVPRRKAEIVAAVNGGLISLNEACRRYQISHEEFHAWVHAYQQSGLPGLRARAARQSRNKPLAEVSAFSGEDQIAPALSAAPGDVA